MKIKEFFATLWDYIVFPFYMLAEKRSNKKLRKLLNEKVFAPTEEAEQELKNILAKYEAYKNGELPEDELIDFTSEEFLKFCNDDK